MVSVISKQEYEQIAQLIYDKDVLLLSDEVYEHMYADENFVSALQIPKLEKNL